MLSYEERLEVVLKSMKTGEIYQLNDKECYFKLQFILFDHCDQFHYHTDNIKEMQTTYEEYIVFSNDTLALLEFEEYSCLAYQTDENDVSSLHIYNSKNENEEFLIEEDELRINNFNNYKSKSNEILFKIVNRN